MNDLDIDLDRNTPWVDMSACVKFGLDSRPNLTHALSGGARNVNWEGPGIPSLPSSLHSPLFPSLPFPPSPPLPLEVGPLKYS